MGDGWGANAQRGSVHYLVAVQRSSEQSAVLQATSSTEEALTNQVYQHPGNDSARRGLNRSSAMLR